MRLVGPNPKYYSIFYEREDDAFVDLTQGSLHDEAYQIDQSAVRYKFYLNSTE